MSEQVIDRATDAGALGGGFAAIFGAVTFNEWIGVIGVGIAAASFGVNLWHKRRMVQLRREELDMERGRNG